MEYFDKTVSAECDCHGVEPCGENKDGFWWGTANCWPVIDDPEDDGSGTTPEEPRLIEATGKLGAEDFDVHAVASSAERVRQWMEGIGCTNVTILYDDKLYKDAFLRHIAETPGMVYVTDEEGEAIKVPDDYESCGDCGYDHDYEYEQAHSWHTKNHGSYS